MTPNDDLFYKVLERIDADPKSFDMATWYGERPDDGEAGCGTVACFAGHTALELGWQPIFFYVDSRRDTDTVVDSTGEAESTIGRVAQDALGLTYQQADKLFDAYNDMGTFATREDVINRWKDIQNESGDDDE